ncbi:hypothetical protein XA26_45450 [Mycolicibacterium fortuitum]|uniref:Uncharacterized protein n=1 Tax=Mycolicibacterium fortuitum TaxID=1766 RepID=A0A0N9XJQ3_MYCFO|nr:hypothetical protein XA26_45450 [Mycolicibacterium fortuitum]
MVRHGDGVHRPGRSPSGFFDGRPAPIPPAGRRKKGVAVRRRE